MKPQNAEGKVKRWIPRIYTIFIKRAMVKSPFIRQMYQKTEWNGVGIGNR